MRLLLAPHNDDETLFASYLCQRLNPRVIVCLRSFRQEARGITYQTREAESEQAVSVLGCAWEQWPFSDERPNWQKIETAIRELDECFSPSDVYAPAYNFDGNGWTVNEQPLYGLFHHDMIGWLAEQVFGDRVRFYQTYSRWHGKVEEGTEIVPDADEVVGKLTALAKYQSQIAEPSTRMHFYGSQREWIKK